MTSRFQLNASFFLDLRFLFNLLFKINDFFLLLFEELDFPALLGLKSWHFLLKITSCFKIIAQLIFLENVLHLRQTIELRFWITLYVIKLLNLREC